MQSTCVSLLEIPTAVFLPASNTTLDGIDSVHRRFFPETQFSVKYDFLTFGLAPVSPEKDIAMLGLFHKISLGLAHPGFSQLFPRAPPQGHRYFSRFVARQHNKQIQDKCDGRQLGYLGRCLVRVHNALPQEVVACGCVSAFQSRLI